MLLFLVQHTVLECLRPFLCAWFSVEHFTNGRLWTMWYRDELVFMQQTSFPYIVGWWPNASAKAIGDLISISILLQGHRSELQHLPILPQHTGLDWWTGSATMLWWPWTTKIPNYHNGFMFFRRYSRRYIYYEADDWWQHMLDFDQQLGAT